jgi:hypothetical protein
VGDHEPDPETADGQHRDQHEAGNPKCPGSGNAPEAMLGHLCVYETALNNRFSVTIRDLEASPSATTSSEEGFGIEATSSGTGGFYSRGVWAVTAP